MYRNFLFLDENTLNEYYSVINNGLINRQEKSSISAKTKAGGVKISGVGGDYKSDENIKTSQIIEKTNALKFNELYDYMNENSDLTYYENMDDEKWKHIGRKNIIEVEVIATIPQIVEQLELIFQLIPTIKNMGQFGENFFEESVDIDKLETTMKILDQYEITKIPIICTAENDEKYKYIMELPTKYIRTSLNDLSGDVTLLGKVHKKYPSDTKVDSFNIIKRLKRVLELSESDISKMVKGMYNKMNIEINGPAMKIIPLALYR